MELKNEIFGCPISEDLSLHLKRYTTNKDWADVSVKTRVGTSTIRDVIYRNNALTKNNSKAIIELAMVALQNCKSEINDAETSIRELNEMLVEETKKEADEVG